MIPSKFKINKILRYIQKKYFQFELNYLVKKHIATRKLIKINSCDFSSFKSRVKHFIQSMRITNTDFQYRYSASCSKPTLYSSAYACMTLSIIGELESYSDKKKYEWARYFNSFQDPRDGLFYDSVISNDIYNDTDWWGARHLALHMITAYSNLGLKPPYEFSFLHMYYDTSYIESWLNTYQWSSESIGTSDIDNKIMNIGSLLQYQRDYWNDAEAGKAVDFLKKYLKEKINCETGLWGGFRVNDKFQRSRMIQFAYHIFPIFFYDNDFSFDHKKIIKHTLSTQNKFGGYGTQSNSSACEDIDSIDILIRLAHTAPDSTAEINESLKKAFSWILHNQMDNGGLVFKLCDEMCYGHPEMFSKKNESSMFPTWFRTLSIAYLARYFSIPEFQIKKTPGLEQ